jgi:hypothetical protein
MRKLWLIGALVLLGTVAVTAIAPAQTTSNGPYYATPSWDQQLPAATRFIVLLNWASAAVLDRETGLVWEQSPSVSVFNWSNANQHCLNLNAGGRTGWRLPTIQEFMSLVDRSAFLPPLPSGHPFTNVQTSTGYWSATTTADNASNAWSLDFVAGFAGSTIKVGNKNVWCVRGGQGVDPQ